MADNARLHDHEKLIAADEIGNIKHLKVKVQFGEDDAAVQVSSANPLPVTLGDAVIEVGEANVTFGAVSDAFGRLKVSNPYTLNQLQFASQLGRTLGGVSDILTLAAFATSNNDEAVGSLAWSEHT
jgi:hypothetical protein